jgi:hypothetical protein
MMALLDPLQVNEELKKANEEHVKAVIAKLNAELERKTTLELQRNVIAAKTVDGKAPSEAACERQARTTPEYLKSCKAEIAAVKDEMDSMTTVEYLRNKVQAALGGPK